MNKIFIFVFMIVTLQTFGQNTKITFVVNTNSLPQNESVFITGNTNSLGNWKPDKIKMKKLSSTKWSKTFNFSKNTILEFKFTKGSWQTEALDLKGNIPNNHELIVKNDTVLNFKISKWKDSLNSSKITKGQITGNVEYLRNLQGKGILPRDVAIWLPPSYHFNLKKRYPVLYMHDGQNLFDPKTSSFGIDWQADETADSLIKSNNINEIIIVGIYNTIDRSNEYAPGVKGENYMKFIVNVLKPLIDKKYRTLPNRENCAVAGSSLGGLISMMLVWQYSNIFSKAACLSPAFVYENVNYVQYVKKTATADNSMIIYIYNGGIGLEKMLQPGVDSMLVELRNIGFKMNKNLFYDKVPAARHSEADWAKILHKPLKIFFNKNKK